MSKRNPFANLEALRQGADVVDFPSAKTTRRAKRSQRLVAFPWAFLVDVCRLSHSRTALAVATYIYRRTHVCNSLTVTLPGGELAELGIDRSMKRTSLGTTESGRADPHWPDVFGPDGQGDLAMARPLKRSAGATPTVALETRERSATATPVPLTLTLSFYSLLDIHRTHARPYR